MRRAPGREAPDQAGRVGRHQFKLLLVPLFLLLLLLILLLLMLLASWRPGGYAWASSGGEVSLLSPCYLLSGVFRGERRSCCWPRCCSPTHALLLVLLLHQSHTLCMSPPGHNDRLPLQTTSSQPTFSLISATGEEFRLSRPSGPTMRRRRR